MLPKSQQAFRWGGRPPQLGRASFWLTLALIVTMMQSCSTFYTQTLFRDKDHEEYFKENAKDEYDVLKLHQDYKQRPFKYRYKLQGGDQITVIYRNTPPELFNNAVAQGGEGSGRAGARRGQQGGIQLEYQVDVKGYIVNQHFGRLKVQGKTLIEVESLLEEKYQTLYESPILDAQMSSMRLFMFGAFGSAGRINVERHNIHLVEAISLAGGISRAGRSNKVKIIRGALSEKPQVIWVNMTKVTAMSHPELMVQDRDIIVVEARPPQAFIQEVQPYTTIINIATLVPTLFFLINRL